MVAISATDAKNRFGEVLELARKEPVRIQKNGRDVAVVLSAEEYQFLSARAGATGEQALMDRLLERSIEKRHTLYQALAR